MRQWLVRAPVLALVLALVAGAFFAGMRFGEGRVPAVLKVAGVTNKTGDALTAPLQGEPVDFMPFWRTWNILENKFVPFGTSTAEEVSREARVLKSIEGLVASYGDPYTVFFPPQQAEDFKIAAKGSLEGIGAVVGEREGKLFVVAPLPDSPAAKAGLKPGDYVRQIDGSDTAGLTVEAAVERIRGEKGTEVRLTIVREGDEEREYTVTRGTIEIPSTRTAVVTRDVPVARPGEPSEPAVGGEPAPTEKRDFFVLQLASFSESSIGAFKRELEQFLESGSETLIIDLRNNPGGYLAAAVDMASWFLPAGTVVVREHVGPERREQQQTSRGYDLLKGHEPNIAILINKGTASAAEILAGALRDHGRAVLVGENSFGKGSVQELVNVTDELALKVTVARWYTPNGTSISQGGLTPDVLLSPETIAAATSSDPWLEAAVEYLARATSTEAQ